MTFHSEVGPSGGYLKSNALKARRFDNLDGQNAFLRHWNRSRGCGFAAPAAPGVEAFRRGRAITAAAGRPIRCHSYER